MKLLFDENLSDRIVPQILDLYPDSTHVKALGLTQTREPLIKEEGARKPSIRVIQR